jgi:rSAM/selenodomain-associated transferase 2
MSRTVSIIIPVLNDALALQRCLEALPRNCADIIVADGGGDQSVRMLAANTGVNYLSCERGRAVQMNAGARSARGEWLWFLHADCIPAPGSIDAICNLDSSTSWGCFRHRIDAPSILLRIIERADNLRARYAGLPYGDQGIFVRRELFEKVGGYPAVPLLEDLLLARALKRIARPRLLRPVLHCDARRWLQHGIVRNTLNNWRILWKYYVRNESPESLAALYHPSSSPPAILASSK